MRDDLAIVEQIQRDLLDVRWPEPREIRARARRRSQRRIVVATAVLAIVGASAVAVASPGIPRRRRCRSPCPRPRRPGTRSAPTPCCSRATCRSRSMCSSASRGWASRSCWIPCSAPAGRVRGARRAGRRRSCPVRRPWCRSAPRRSSPSRTVWSRRISSG
ncbi:hypothetical protein NKG94_29765 [Micromonospora sp. M12]